MHRQPAVPRRTDLSLNGGKPDVGLVMTGPRVLQERQTTHVDRMSACR
jgi:hypothetical protein